MSQVYYQELWKETQNRLRENFDLEEKIKKKSPFQDVSVAKWLIGHLYINYVEIVNKLDKCYDQMIHPQKRELIGKLLDLAMGRLLELKAEVVKIELDNYCFFDSVLIELKLTHQDMEIQVPRYYWKDKEKIKAHRRKLINNVFEEAEREEFRMKYLENIPDEGKEEAWAKYLAEEEQQRQEREKLEEQQRKLMGGKTRELSSLEKLIKEIKEPEASQCEDSVLTEAIHVLQRHERARQGRVRAAWAKKYKRMKEQGTFAIKIPKSEGNRAAAIIQKHWRRHKQRLRQTKQKEKLLQLLGVAKPSYTNSTGESKLEKTEKLMRKLRERNKKEYHESFEPIKEKVIAFYSTQMEESIIDEIRNWFMWFFERSNFLPDYPPPDLVMPKGNILGIPKQLGPDFADKAFPQAYKKALDPVATTALGLALCGLSSMGGSALITAGHWIGPEEFLICQKELQKMSNQPAKKDQQGKKGGKTKENALGGKKKGPPPDFKLKSSNFTEPLKKAARDYTVTWSCLDESDNHEQRYIYNLVKDEKCFELSMEVRHIVDEVMRLELEVLKDALERDKNPKKKKKKSKKPKPKPKREKKAKEKKDPTGDRTLEDLFMELYKNGIIRDYEEVHLKDYIGERSYCAYEFRQNNIDWPPSPGDVKDLILQLCILPLGSSTIHQLAPLVKSVCLLGSENSGKEFLARIICSETCSVMFDLTSANVAGKYPGKSGLKMLEHLIEKMSRALQPSVVFIDDTEKTFYKKVPKEERHLEPKRMAGLVKKLLKGIKPSDQVLLVGVSSQPWLAKKKKFLKTYQQLILVPQMDYGSYFRIWQTLLTPYHSVSRTFDVSCLARASKGYSAKAIIDVVKNVFTIKRISRSCYDPFKPTEFLEELLKSKSIDDKLLEKCLKFYSSTDLPKKKAKRLQKIREELDKTKKKS